MKGRSIVLLATAFLAGCGAPQMAVVPPIKAFGSVNRAASGERAKNQQLVYVSDVGSSIVSIFTWSGKLVETLSGFVQPAGLCTDGTGDVYVTDNYGHSIYEFAHGGTAPIKTLKDLGELPESCAVDPATGDLAVINLSGHDSGGSVSIYKHAVGKRSVYAGDTSLTGAYFGAYDNKGNLFIDGYDQNSNSGVLAVLPSGGKTLKNVTLDKRLDFPGGVQWDGKYVAIADAYESAIYRVQISGSAGSVVGTTPLEASSDIYQFAIANREVAVANDEVSDVGDVMLWKYPAGGRSTRHYGELYAPFGLAVSLAGK